MLVEEVGQPRDVAFETTPPSKFIPACNRRLPALVPAPSGRSSA